MKVWIQQVDVLYTKASRGMPAAAARNQLARAFPFLSGTAERYVLERYLLDEARGFAPELVQTEAAALPPVNVGALTVRMEDELLSLSFRPGASGKPRRRKLPPASKLRPGQTARLTINGRHASYSGQHYLESTFNVFLGNAERPDVFVEREPDVVVDQRENLF